MRVRTKCSSSDSTSEFTLDRSASAAPKTCTSSAILTDSATPEAWETAAADVAAEQRRTRRDRGRRPAKSTAAVTMTATATPALSRNAEAASVRNISAAEKPLGQVETADPAWDV